MYIEYQHTLSSTLFLVYPLKNEALIFLLEKQLNDRAMSILCQRFGLQWPVCKG